MLVEKAIEMSYNAHKGQYDKAGKPYISHPIYIANKMKTNEEKIVALLHDVIEDTQVTIDCLKKEGYCEKTIKAIEAITKKPGEDYFDYINRLKEDPLARKIKIEDLKHNMDLNRIKNPSEKDLERIEKYKRALEILRGEWFPPAKN